MLEIPDTTGGSPADTAFDLVASAPTSRVSGDQTIQNVVQVTARSKLYGVTFTWFVEPQNWNIGNNVGLVGAKTADVNAVCAHARVIGFRTVQDQDPSRLLLNYAVITVGTDDGSVQGDVIVGMQNVNSAPTFQQIDALWTQLSQSLSG